MQSTAAILLFRIALVSALLGIIYLATSPIDIPLASSINDKTQHLGAFLLLAFLSDFAFPRQPWNWRIFLPLLGYGLLLEIVQYFLPHRFFSLADLGADALGLALYPLLRFLLERSLRLNPG